MEVVVTEVELPQPGELADLGGKGVEVVVPEVELPQPGELADLGGKGVEVVVPEVELLERRKLENFRGDLDETPMREIDVRSRRKKHPKYTQPWRLAGHGQHLLPINELWRPDVARRLVERVQLDIIDHEHRGTGVLGHASLDTTKRYLEATANELRDAVRAHPARLALQGVTHPAPANETPKAITPRVSRSGRSGRQALAITVARSTSSRTCTRACWTSSERSAQTGVGRTPARRLPRNL